MALTVSLDIPKVERISRNLGILTGTIAFDSSYPTGGESASDITGYFKTCLRLVCDSKGGYIFTWDKSNGKIKAFNTTDVDAASDAPGPEVGNGTDLSSLTGVSFIAVGLI